jgi:hypothetical protein
MIVHFINFGDRGLNLLRTLAIAAAAKHWRPDEIWYHCDTAPTAQNSPYLEATVRAFFRGPQILSRTTAIDPALDKLDQYATTPMVLLDEGKEQRSSNSKLFDQDDATPIGRRGPPRFRVVLLTAPYPDRLDDSRSIPFIQYKVDMYRLDVLYHFGGVYADMDVLALNPMPPDIESFVLSPDRYFGLPFRSIGPFKSATRPPPRFVIATEQSDFDQVAVSDLSRMLPDSAREKMEAEQEGEKSGWGLGKLAASRREQPRLRRLLYDRNLSNALMFATPKHPFVLEWRLRIPETLNDGRWAFGATGLPVELLRRHYACYQRDLFGSSFVRDPVSVSELIIPVSFSFSSSSATTTTLTKEKEAPKEKEEEQATEKEEAAEALVWVHDNLFLSPMFYQDVWLFSSPTSSLQNMARWLQVQRGHVTAVHYFDTYHRENATILRYNELAVMLGAVPVSSSSSSEQHQQQQTSMMQQLLSPLVWSIVLEGVKMCSAPFLAHLLALAMNERAGSKPDSQQRGFYVELLELAYTTWFETLAVFKVPARSTSSSSCESELLRPFFSDDKMHPAALADTMLEFYAFLFHEKPQLSKRCAADMVKIYEAQRASNGAFFRYCSDPQRLAFLNEQLKYANVSLNPSS